METLTPAQRSLTKSPRSCLASKPTSMQTSSLLSVSLEPSSLPNNALTSEIERKQLLEELKVHGRIVDNADPIFTEQVRPAYVTFLNSMLMFGTS